MPRDYDASVIVILFTIVSDATAHDRGAIVNLADGNLINADRCVCLGPIVTRAPSRRNARHPADMFMTLLEGSFYGRLLHSSIMFLYDNRAIIGAKE